MTISNPILRLTFLEDDTVRTVGSNYIVKDSISFSQQILNGLESSSNTVTLQLNSKCPSTWKRSVSDTHPTIIDTLGDVKAVLLDGSTPLFTGYLNEKISWTVTSSGEQALNITLEDVGTRLLPKAYIRNGEKALLRGSAASSNNGVIQRIATQAGITLDANFPTIDISVCRVVESGISCQELLKSLCMELGYAYYFTNEGKLNLKKIDCTTITGIPEYNKDNLYRVDNNVLILSKQMRQYKSSKVTYKTHSTWANNYVYKDIAGRSSDHPDCYIGMDRGGTYPDYNNYTDSYITATDLDSGKEIVYIDNVVGEFEKTPATALFDYSITKSGVDKIAVKVRHNSNSPDSLAYVTKLQAKALITFVSSENVIFAGETASTDESDNVITTECVWLHDKTNADIYARLLVDYYKHCNKQFQFYAGDTINCGDIVKITDNQYSGISNAVLVIAKSFSDHTNICKYTAVSIAPFEKTLIPITENKTEAPPTVINSSPGTKGDRGSIWFNGNYVPTPSQPADAKAGDYFINTTTNIIYKKEADTSWSIVTDISGKVFQVSLSSYNYKRYKRETLETQSIRIQIYRVGYTGTPVITSDYGTISGNELIIPYNNNYDTINLMVSLTDAPTWSCSLTVIDESEADGYIGCINYLPTTITIEGQEKAVSNGDYFIASNDFHPTNIDYYYKGHSYKYSDGTWVEMTSSNSSVEQLLNVLHQLKANNISYDQINNPQNISWFKEIVSDSIIAGSLKASDGFFDNITIGNLATFNGSVTSKVFKTVNRTESQATTYTSQTSNSSVPVGFYWDEVCSSIDSKFPADVYPTTYNQDLSVTYQSSGIVNGYNIVSTTFHNALSSGLIFQDWYTGDDPDVKVKTFEQTFTNNSTSPVNHRFVLRAYIPSSQVISNNYKIYVNYSYGIDNYTNSRIHIIDENTRFVDIYIEDVDVYGIYPGHTFKIKANAYAIHITDPTIILPDWKLNILHAEVHSSYFSREREISLLTSTGSTISLNNLSRAGMGDSLLAYVINTQNPSFGTYNCPLVAGSTWTIGITKYFNFPGKTGGTASSSGYSTKIIGGSIYIRTKSGTTSIPYSNLQSVVWSNTGDFTYTLNNGTTVTYSAQNSIIREANISLTFGIIVEGVKSRGILPIYKADLSGTEYDEYTFQDPYWTLGTTDRKWYEVHSQKLVAEQIVIGGVTYTIGTASISGNTVLTLTPLS